MSHYFNLKIVLHYDFLITYLAIMFFIHWILANLRLKRLGQVFRRVWESS